MSFAQVALPPLEAELALLRGRLNLDRELRMALVGKTGVGKSSTANTICGKVLFKSGIKATSMTKICQEGKTIVQGKPVVLIDTPGIFGSGETPAIVENEIKRCVHLGAPGLHAILFVMDINRFRDEDIETIGEFLKFFTEELMRYVIVVFTHGDKLAKERIPLDKFLEDAPASVNYFLKQCDNRTILFNNELNRYNSSEQVSLLLTMVESLKLSNENYYSDAIFKDAEKHVQRREIEIKDQLTAIYEQKQRNFERTLRREMRAEREEEIKKLKENYEDRLNRVRDEIRNEIAKKDSICTIS